MRFCWASDFDFRCDGGGAVVRCCKGKQVPRLPLETGKLAVRLLMNKALSALG